MTTPEINVTPLIDVLLVLLIIFMVVTPVKPEKFDARIPSEPTNDGAQTPQDMLIVTVDASSALGLNTEKLEASVGSPAALITRLRQVFAAREQNLVNERTVFIKAPKDLHYGAVAKVVDAVKMAGAAPISLQIDRLD